MRKGRPKVALILTTDERQRLESLAHRSRSAAAVARRARIILACADGADSKVVAQRCMSRPERSANGAGGSSCIDWMGSTMSRVPAPSARSRMRRWKT